MNLGLTAILIALFQPTPSKSVFSCKTLATDSVKSLERLYGSKAKYSMELVSKARAHPATGTRVWSVTVAFESKFVGRYLVTTTDRFEGWPCVVTQIQYLGNDRPK